jgi:hypothetical protein
LFFGIACSLFLILQSLYVPKDSACLASESIQAEELRYEVLLTRAGKGVFYDVLAISCHDTQIHAPNPNTFTIVNMMLHTLAISSPSFSSAFFRTQSPPSQLAIQFIGPRLPAFKPTQHLHISPHPSARSSNHASETRLACLTPSTTQLPWTGRGGGYTFPTTCVGLTEAGHSLGDGRAC